MNGGVAGLVVGALVVSVVVTVVQPLTRRDVDAAAYVAALQQQRAALHAGDVVLVHPPWRDDVVTAVRAAGVVDARTPVTEAFAPRHGDAWPPLFVLADARWPLPRAVRERAVVVDDGDGGDVAVYRVDGARDDGAGDDAAALAGAHVSVVEGGGVVDCPWQPAARRHVCAGLPEWMHVGDETLTVAGKKERCTWAHPRTGATLVVDYGVVAVDGAVALDVALADSAADNATGAAVDAVVFVDGVRADVSVQHERGFHRAVVDAGDKTSAHVRLEFTTPHDGQRHTCYRLATRLGAR